jgi:hypothetical protein
MEIQDKLLLMKLISSSGVINLFQSWVPRGTTFRMYSAPQMARAQEAVVLFKVVMNKDPPG